MIVIIANRGQYNHRIYRTLKYLGAESKLVKSDLTPEGIHALDPSGIVVGGGPFIEECGNSKEIIKEFYREIPILGICLGHQLLSTVFGGEVRTAEAGVYADAEIVVDDENRILKGLGPSFSAWVSHKDEVKTVPPEFKVLAHSETCRVEAMAHEALPLFGVQFHPEVEHTPKGPQLFKNFLELCK